MFDNFQDRRAKIGDVEIAYWIGGAGPPVLLLHGYPQSRALWARVAPILAERFTVVCADLRGYGDSAKPTPLRDAANYAFRSMAEDQVGLMRSLGFESFHLVGHDRGGRTAHRLALDHPGAVRSLVVMDIVPTHTMFMRADRRLAAVYWHWYFLQQPSPFPERMIGNDPDFFFETCLFGWGAAGADDFAPEQLAEYRRCWRDAGMIAGSCGDYRAAAGVDLDNDSSDLDKKVECPTLVLYGAHGAMGRMFDLAAEWRPFCTDVTAKAMQGGHFFIDQHPQTTAAELLAFLEK